MKVTLVAHVVSVENNESYSVYVLDNSTGSCQARNWRVPPLRTLNQIEWAFFTLSFFSTINPCQSQHLCSSHRGHKTNRFVKIHQRPANQTYSGRAWNILSPPRRCRCPYHNNEKTRTSTFISHSPWMISLTAIRFLQVWKTLLLEKLRTNTILLWHPLPLMNIQWTFNTRFSASSKNSLIAPTVST